MEKTQGEKILRYMKEHGSITQREAAQHFDCYRLSARIFDLRKDHNITTKNEPNKGAGTHARYYLIEEGEDNV